MRVWWARKDVLMLLPQHHQPLPLVGKKNQVKCREYANEVEEKIPDGREVHPVVVENEGENGEL
jgi:hypothetical protein